MNRRERNKANSQRLARIRMQGPLRDTEEINYKLWIVTVYSLSVTSPEGGLPHAGL